MVILFVAKSCFQLLLHREALNTVNCQPEHRLASKVAICGIEFEMVLVPFRLLLFMVVVASVLP